MCFVYFMEKNTYLCSMILEKLSIINYKNIAEASLELSPKINCLIGQNGVGKTNVLDAIYYLSFCRSANNPIDSQVIRHGEDFFMLEGKYNEDLTITAAMKRGQKKHFRRDKKEYKRLSEHIGLIPIVIVAPSDTLLIEGGSEERRRLMDLVISQYDRSYIESMNRYNKALQQRNVLLKQEEEPDAEVMSLFEEQMASEGEHIYKCRKAFVLDVIQRDRFKDRAVGYSLHGIHRDDLEFCLGGHPMKREGSQGQNKTFVIALKLAQFDFLKRTNSNTTPLLLLDDIFDKLDANRVEQIVKLVAGDDYGQIFITDTNRDHLDQILSASSHDYKIFHVDNGEINV